MDVEEKEILKAVKLHRACVEGDLPRVTKLLHKGSDPNLQDARSGKTALHKAAEAAQVDAVDLLVAEGARTELRDREGFTALERAEANYAAVTEILSRRYRSTSVSDAEFLVGKAERLLKSRSRDIANDLIRGLASAELDVAANELSQRESAWRHRLASGFRRSKTSPEVAVTIITAAGPKQVAYQLLQTDADRLIRRLRHTLS